MLNKTALIVLAVLTLTGGGSFYVLSKNAPRDGKPAAPSENHSDAHAHDDHAEERTGDADPHEHAKKAEPAEGASHSEAVKIDPAAARALHIDVLDAGSGTIRQTIDVNGRLTLDQTTTVQVKARFPGIIRSAVHQPGDVVQAGETLATVESNDSLQVYPVKSPVAGTVITRTANVGELAGDGALFIVADLSKLWVELFVFARDGDKVKSGQLVRIRRLDDTAEADATLTQVLPTADPSSQTIIARASLANAEGLWRSGMTVRAAIAHAETTVPVAVRSQAIQRMEGASVVFLQTAADTYQAQPIEIGISDGTWTEVRSGLTAGQRYVASNSFIIKAEMGKAGAEHDH